jgi:hypothetical protein
MYSLLLRPAFGFAARVSEALCLALPKTRNRCRREHQRFCWTREHALAPGFISADKQGEIRFGL